MATGLSSHQGNFQKDGVGLQAGKTSLCEHALALASAFFFLSSRFCRNELSQQLHDGNQILSLTLRDEY